MRLLAALVVMVLALSACLPQVGESSVATLVFERDGEAVKATLALSASAHEVLVLWRGEAGEVREEFARLPRGEYVFEHASPGPVACSVSGYVGPQYFLLFC